MTDDPAVAAQALLEGRLAVLPTETVYGLGARADLPHAIARVYAAKGRPADHPLIVHVLDAEALDACARARITAFLPAWEATSNDRTED